MWGVFAFCVPERRFSDSAKQRMINGENAKNKRRLFRAFRKVAHFSLHLPEIYDKIKIILTRGPFRSEQQLIYMSSLLKAFDVLDCFQDDKQELGISDIAVLVGMPVSSVHRLIQSLEYEGMLIQNRENKKYSLGSKLMAMSVKCRTSRSFGRIASKYVDQLGQLTGETVNLSTCSGDRIINVYHAESHFVLRPNFPLYTSYPAYKTGVGRVFLSWMGDPALKWIYENNKDDISMTQEEFLAMLHQARRDGYALDDQVFSAGLRCVAAPVFLTGSKPMFAISISAPLSRMDDALYARSRELVTDFAARISHDIQAAEARV